MNLFICQIKNNFYLQRNPPQFQFVVCGAVSTGSRNKYLTTDVSQNVNDSEITSVSMIITVQVKALQDKQFTLKVFSIFFYIGITCRTLQRYYSTEGYL
jgi:fucose permease